MSIVMYVQYCTGELIVVLQRAFVNTLLNIDNRVIMQTDKGAKDSTVDVGSQVERKERLY